MPPCSRMHPTNTTSRCASVLATAITCFQLLLHLPLLPTRIADRFHLLIHSDDDEVQRDICQWGTYRPFPYVGLRCRSPHSPLVGMMWYKPSLLRQTTPRTCDNAWQDILRHECSYADGLSNFGWTRHDGHAYATQFINDPVNQFKLTTTWVQINATWWTLRIDGQPLAAETDGNSDLSIVFYLSTPGDATATFQDGIVKGAQQSEQDEQQSLKYRLFLNETTANRHATYWNPNTRSVTTYNATPYFVVLQTATHDDSAVFNPKPHLISELQDTTAAVPSRLFDPRSLYRADTVMQGNLILLQLFYDGAFRSVDLHFQYIAGDGESDSIANDMDDDRDGNHGNDDGDNSVNHMIQRRAKEFEQRFQRTFETNHWTAEQLTTAQYALSNMLGSTAYMHGDRQIVNTTTHAVQSQPVSTALLAIVPDRPSHAQGYLWDEGFQQHLLQHWDRALSMSIVESWMAQQDTTLDFGWIARQQIIGDEVRWSARPSSWPQIVGTANPPSLHLFLEQFMMHQASGVARGTDSDSDDQLIAFLKRIWQPFHSHVDWYLRTQQAMHNPYLFRWQGRTKSYCLPSGMDDYPRAPIRTTQEAHLDLQVWMIVSTRTASRMASMLGRAQDANHYEDLSRQIQQAMEAEFWNADLQIYDEFYFDVDTNSTTKRWNGHFGYLNFWPIFLCATADTTSQRFRVMTKKLLDKTNGVWSDHGLRSLSTFDPYYEHGDNYWTGPIWININYLVLSAFHKYTAHPQRYPMDDDLRHEIRVGYNELRRNVIDLVVSNYIRTGFIWEVYSGQTGQGFNNHPFTGWSALIVNVLGELY